MPLKFLSSLVYLQVNLQHPQTKTWSSCCRKIMPLNLYAIYVWNMLVSSSEIPNNIRVYFTQFTIYKSTIWMILLSTQAYRAM